MATVLVVQHVPHERLGTFEAPLRRAGCSIRPLHAYDPKADWPFLDGSGILGVVSMGGPMSVREQGAHPWIGKELALLREAVRRGLPVLGVCLGAQLLAAALGAQVTKNPQPEIGWYPLVREPGAEGDPLFLPFGRTETVFQWHGDTFALPAGAVRLASSPLCREQAFRCGEAAWGLQFHLEMTEPMIRAWLRQPANRAELAALKGVIDPMAIRRQGPRHLRRLQELAEHVATAFSQAVKGAVHARRV